MEVIVTKSSLVATVEDMYTHQCFTVHAQRMVPDTANRLGKQALQELKEQSVHYDTTYYLVNAVRRVQYAVESMMCWSVESVLK